MSEYPVNLKERTHQDKIGEKEKKEKKKYFS